MREAGDHHEGFARVEVALHSLQNLLQLAGPGGRWGVTAPASAGHQRKGDLRRAPGGFVALSWPVLDSTPMRS